MIQTIRKAWGIPELRKKIIFTLLILLIFRIGNAITVPYVDVGLLETYLDQMGGTILGLYNVMSGGAFAQATVFALSIQPYINASIIIQLLTVAIPALERLAKDGGEEGRKKIQSITRYTTVGIAILQAVGYYFMMRNYNLLASDATGIWPALVIVVSFIAGSSFVMWMGEQVTEFGVGNGISIILFAGILSRVPTMISSSIESVHRYSAIKDGSLTLESAMSTFGYTEKQAQAYLDSAVSPVGVVLLIVGMLALIVFIVFINDAERRIPVQYAKRQVGRKMYGGQSTHLPLRVNTAGVIPPIFASSLLLFPATMANFDIADWLKTAASWFTPSSILYNVIFIALIFFFCFFYTAIIFDPKDVAENLKKAGGFIPGIRPGEKTQEYLDAVLSRLTLWGGVYISVISVLPMLLIAEFNVPFYFGGTSILILVGVAMDFMSQIESHLISRQYEGLMGKTRIKGRS